MVSDRRGIRRQIFVEARGRLLKFLFAILMGAQNPPKRLGADAGGVQLRRLAGGAGAAMEAAIAGGLRSTNTWESCVAGLTP